MPRDRRIRGLPLVLGLAGCALLAGSLAAWAGGPDRFEIRMEHSRFVSAPLEFAPGQTVTFVLRNTDPIDHEFILGDEVLQRRHETGTEPYHDALPNEVTIPAGASVTTTLTFGAAGDLVLGCHLPGHYAYGMRAEVRVR